jgi:hypothetical protein
MQLFIATVITRALLAPASEHTFSWCILPPAFCPPCWVIPLQLLLLLLNRKMENRGFDPRTSRMRSERSAN